MKIESILGQALEYVSNKASKNIPAVASMQENRKFEEMRKQIDDIENELLIQYSQIGERYVDDIKNNSDLKNFDVTDLVDSIKTNLEKKSDLEDQLVEKEMKEKEKKQNKEKAKSQKIFDDEKAILDKALLLEVITQKEYDEKLTVIQKKLDNFLEVFRLGEQLSMGLINQQEHDEKLKKIINQ